MFVTIQLVWFAGRLEMPQTKLFKWTHQRCELNATVN